MTAIQESYVTPPCPPPTNPFKIEAVVVCDRYSDFLRITLPANKFIFDKIVVVTAFEDVETRRICEFNHVECVLSDVMESRKNHFRKGMGINEGLRKLDGDAWVVHLDADIWLPPQTRALLKQAYLNPEMLYGIDRFNVRGYDAWEKFLQQPKLQHEAGAYIHLNNGFPLGTRVMSEEAGGWIAIGFFQMWNPAVSGVREYPEGHTTAGREDMLMAKKWSRCKRALIPEVVGYHLESDDAQMSSNWSGRKTSLFASKN